MASQSSGRHAAQLTELRGGEQGSALLTRWRGCNKAIGNDPTSAPTDWIPLTREVWAWRCYRAFGNIRGYYMVIVYEFWVRACLLCKYLPRYLCTYIRSTYAWSPRGSLARPGSIPRQCGEESTEAATVKSTTRTLARIKCSHYLMYLKCICVLLIT